MAVTVCPACGEMCRDYDLFCPKCGNACSGFDNIGCDGICYGCEYDMPHGCTKPMEDVPFSSPYPHSIVEKKGKYVMVEESEKRNRIGTVVLSLLPTGAIGIHAFYARFYLWGLVHLLLFCADIALRVCSVSQLGIFLMISWGLAVVEGLLVMTGVIKSDGKRYPFA